jgi:signal transduction histidine kinase
MSTRPDSPLLSVHHLSRQFGAVAALVDISFSLAPGEILGVVGMRGAGKSTLFHLLSGLYLPSRGEIRVNGQRVTFHSPRQAQELGIEAALQSPKLANNLSVLENIFLGRELCRFQGPRIWPDEGKMAERARKFLGHFDLPDDLVRAHPAALSDEQRMIIALGRAMIRHCRILLLDDALSGLSYARQQNMLAFLKELSAENIAVVINSDDLKQIFAITDRILVLYQGRQVALRTTASTSPREIVELIVGTDRQEQITPVIWAFENYHTVQQQAEDLRRSQAVLTESLQAQDSLNRQLIETLNEQLQALDRLNLALQEANRRLITEREAERKALARELHDQVIQDLLSYNYQLEAAESDLTQPSQKSDLAAIRRGIRNVVSSLRQVCSDLRPPTIDSHGLSAAIRSLAHQWSEQSGIEVDLEVDPALGRLPEIIELSVFRIVQEGLSNVRKHANASLVQLSLKRSANASLVVRLADNGQGFNRPINLARLSEEKHFGLVGISERVSLLGGTLHVHSPGSIGSEMQIEIPSPFPG